MILINVRLLEINVLAIFASVKSPATERAIDCIIIGVRSNMIVPDWIDHLYIILMSRRRISLSKIQQNFNNRCNPLPSDQSIQFVINIIHSRNVNRVGL